MLYPNLCYNKQPYKEVYVCLKKVIYILKDKNHTSEICLNHINWGKKSVECQQEIYLVLRNAFCNGYILIINPLSANHITCESSAKQTIHM